MSEQKETNADEIKQEQRAVKAIKVNGKQDPAQDIAKTITGHTNGVDSVAISADGRYGLSGSSFEPLRLWEFVWQYEFPEPADWDEGARPYLEIFLTLHCPYGDDGISRVGKPIWNEGDFNKLLEDLQLRGFGWLRPEGVRKKLEEMTANWQGPPSLPGQ